MVRENDFLVVNWWDVIAAVYRFWKANCVVWSSDAQRSQQQQSISSIEHERCTHVLAISFGGMCVGPDELYAHIIHEMVPLVN